MVALPTRAILRFFVQTNGDVHNFLIYVAYHVMFSALSIDATSKLGGFARKSVLTMIGRTMH